MKITIELNTNEVAALKAYLKEVSHDINPKITKEDIKQEIEGMISGCMQSGSLGDYYRQYCENPENNRGLQLGDNSMVSDNGHDDY